MICYWHMAPRFQFRLDKKENHKHNRGWFSTDWAQNKNYKHNQTVRSTPNPPWPGCKTDR